MSEVKPISTVTLDVAIDIMDMFGIPGEVKTVLW